MGSLTLPIIDFSEVNLNPGTCSWIQKQTAVRRALEEFGCFNASYDTVPLEAHKEMYGALQDLFNLPRETRVKCVYEDMPYHGYIGLPGCEGSGIVNATALENVENFTNLMWPEGNPSFCETTYSYIRGLVKLEQMVRRMVIESFGLEKYYDSCIESSNYNFRGHLYTPQVNEGGMPVHTDKSFLTIIHQNGVNGLQVQTKDGHWINPTPSPASFIVMVGDYFMAWSNGRLHAPYHRVVLNGTDTRYSVLLYSSGTGIIEAPQELVDEEHPLLFKPFHYLDLYRLAVNGNTGRSTTVRHLYGV